MRDLFTKDLGWKLFSLLLGVVIWLTVHRILEPKSSTASEQGSTVTYDNLPIEIVSGTGDVRDYRVAPASVKVTVGGPEEIMATLQASQIRAIVDLTDIKPDDDLHRAVDISPPIGVTLISVEPSRVAVIPPPKH
jgi:YbbR domain-containing protein